MAQIIIYKNQNGNVSTCSPTGELSIEEVLSKDCPEGAIIVDDSTLPQGDDAQFFDAWELNDGVVSVNLEKAKAQHLAKYNANSLQQAQKRQLNTLAGLPNEIDNTTWQAKLASDRTAIASATTTTELLGVSA